MSVPQGYPSPKALIETLVNFRNMASRIRVETKSMSEKFQCWFHEMEYSYEIATQVEEAITHALTLTSQVPSVPPLERLRKLLIKLPSVAEQIKIRHKSNGAPRPTLEIADEYDVQDLLRSVLHIEFDDIRAEEWTPSYAGNSKRVDFLLPKDSVIIEVKKASQKLKQLDISEQLTIDIAYYKKHPSAKHLVCLVWDEGKFLTNSVALKSDLEESNDGFVEVVIVR
jgi:hypothetical protein